MNNLIPRFTINNKPRTLAKTKIGPGTPFVIYYAHCLWTIPRFLGMYMYQFYFNMKMKERKHSEINLILYFIFTQFLLRI